MTTQHCPCPNRRPELAALVAPEPQSRRFNGQVVTSERLDFKSFVALVTAMFGFPSAAAIGKGPISAVETSQAAQHRQGVDIAQHVGRVAANKSEPVRLVLPHLPRPTCPTEEELVALFNDSCLPTLAAEGLIAILGGQPRPYAMSLTAPAAA